MTTKIERRIKIKYRVRNKISGTAECPRMSVFRSNKQIYVQIIDDLSGKTLAAASSLGIPKKRSNFFRPMMDFSKKEILQYLSEKNIQFRTDKTNFENIYTRNKIRNLFFSKG